MTAGAADGGGQRQRAGDAAAACHWPPLIAALLVALAATPLQGQLPHLMSPTSPWLDVNYPKVFWTPREGFTAGAYLGLIRQLSFEQADLPPPYAGAITADGQVSTSGSRFLTLEGRFPLLVSGWRFVSTLSAQRRARENYFGIGNESVYDENLVVPGQKHYYQARETRWYARGEAQRRITGGLRVLAGFHAERWRVEPLSGSSVLAADALAGMDPSIGRNMSDITLRGGLVFDTRDDEPAPSRGVLLELIHSGSVGGDVNYTRTTGSAAGYLPVTENLVLSARAVGQHMGGFPRLGSYHLIEASDRPYQGLGGGLSHRALLENRYLGRHKLLLNLDARYHLVNVPRTARLTLAAFLDAGRVFETTSFSLTTDRLRTGGGVGLFFQLGRSGILGMTTGVGPDGLVLDFTTRWTY